MGPKKATKKASSKVIKPPASAGQSNVLNKAPEVQTGGHQSTGKVQKELQATPIHRHNTRSNPQTILPRLSTPTRKPRKKRVDAQSPEGPPQVLPIQQNQSSPIPTVESCASLSTFQLETGELQEVQSETEFDSDQEQATEYSGRTIVVSHKELNLIKMVLKDKSKYAQAVNSNEPSAMAYQLEINRNVDMEPTESGDPFDFDGIQSILNDEEEEESKRLQAVLWTHERKKCLDSSEALFQSTMMMSMMDRSRLFFDKQTNRNEVFDFSIDQPWKCPHMPTRGITDEEATLISLPKPDLCVYFRRDVVLTERCKAGLSPALQRMIMVDGSSEEERKRAFPFLTIEAKKGSSTQNDKTAKYQSLNNASQALHNMYEFFREAKMKPVFFKDVRFFTIVAVASGCIVRIHRAVNVHGTGRIPIVEGYPLKFEYKVLAELEGNQYTQQAMVQLLEKIIWGYGIQLRDALRQACEALDKTILATGSLLKNRNVSYYRYDQTIVLRGSRQASVAGSQMSGQPSRPTAEPTPASSRDSSAVSNNVLARDDDVPSDRFIRESRDNRVDLREAVQTIEDGADSRNASFVSVTSHKSDRTLPRPRSSSSNRTPPRQAKILRSTSQSDVSQFIHHNP